MKKIFTKMCLNNWGGISHKVLEFNEYVNLFSGMSGSGKSTVMDAIQVILYGSLSSSFLNKAADDAKNKRSVMSYLRGEQKDGSANRANQDFHTIIALEIKDTATQNIRSIGAFFEVRKGDTELKKYSYFSHSGPIPEDAYLNSEGFVYSKKELANLIDSRKASKYNKGRGEVNRFYASNEAYISNLNDTILGCIDGGRFRTMQKSSIALKMSNGTGQFIRDYMFPKSEGTIIEKLSEQLGAYRDIKEKIDDIKMRIDMLTKIKENGIQLINTQTELEETKTRICCIDIMDAENKIAAWEVEREGYEAEIVTCKEKKVKLEAERDRIIAELIQVRSDASGLESKKQHLKDLQEKADMLSDNSSLWRHIVKGLRQWGEDDVARDFISNSLLEDLETFGKQKITVKKCEELKAGILAEKEEMDQIRNEYNDQKKDVAIKLKEKKQLVDDMKNNRKSYSEHVKQARTSLEQKLQTLYGRKIKVHVFADLFDIVEPEWKDAIEGRLGSLKLCLITEPEYAHNAAVVFQSLKRFEDVHLIHSEAIMKAENPVFENSLYEAVSCKDAYVDACLRHYIGRIVKCRSVEELEKVREGVTPDCYSYSNFIFRHLKKKDYTTGACIGSKVSKEKLASYEAEIAQLEEKHGKLSRITEGLKGVMEYESLSRYDSEHLVKLADSQEELTKVMAEKEELKQEIRKLSEGEYKHLEEKRRQLEQLQEDNNKNVRQNDEQLLKMEKLAEGVRIKTGDKKEQLRFLRMGYIPNRQLEEEIQQMLRKITGLTLKNKLQNKKTTLENTEQEQLEMLTRSRNEFIQKYPSCNFSGSEKSNDVYLEKLSEYQKNFEPEYQKEFDKQVALVYNTLRQNIIAKIHGDIKAAQRHKNEINRMLRDTTFADSTYQIKIEAAKNEDGQFYEMLMAPELDSKNPEFDEYDGQISLGDDLFFKKYEHKIQLLTEKFMPPKGGEDERTLKQSRQEMEKYADYRTYLQFNMYEQVVDEDGVVIRENYVDDMAGRDSGGEGQNPKYVALMAGFAMLYMNQSNRDSKIKLVLLDEAFSKMDQKRSEVCLKYARKLDLQLIVCVPDERLQSLIRNVDCVYGFRRSQNQISMMHIDKGRYLSMVEGE